MRVIVQIMEHVLIVSSDVVVMDSVYLLRNIVTVLKIVLMQVMKNANLGKLFPPKYFRILVFILLYILIGQMQRIMIVRKITLDYSYVTTHAFR